MAWIRSLVHEGRRGQTPDVSVDVLRAGVHPNTLAVRYRQCAAAFDGDGGQSLVVEPGGDNYFGFVQWIGAMGFAERAAVVRFERFVNDERIRCTGFLYGR